MNIYLLNILFAVVGVAIAVVPLIVGMMHQSRHDTSALAPTHSDVFGPRASDRELEAVL